MTAPSEAQRLQRLHALGILDTPGDDLFRGLAEQALGVVPGTTIAAVSLVDAERQWFKTIIGLGAKETSRAVSFCSHTIETEDCMVVEDATKDERFANNPLVTSAPAIRFYAGIRLAGGVGALCVIGTSPRRIRPGEIEKLSKIAQYVDIQLLSHGVLANVMEPKA
ncbi:histidine kinase [Caulobacter segnis]|uniref:Histidine kinase n=2 Tax=Caulobacter segnis TaxID=88688 RepID=A0ABN5IZZ2_9CAUL|nr:GAF domain-containing protein [Caulobacter segnis]ADG10189.1 putative GAF sensor protein [Caulobacter segnis ATCC 21756]AVQ04385.1 histidine kinase [Caulobacter segnis]